MTAIRHFVIAALLAVSATVVLASGTGHGSWLNNVPPSARSRPNPYATDPDAAVAGEKLYEQHCAQCHGPDANGRPGKPSLHSHRILQAAPGELEWLLTNGVLRHGMPSWSRLPEQQRWQIVSFLKSIK
jgi:mono/diheme cytochrome c family protein